MLSRNHVQLHQVQDTPKAHCARTRHEQAWMHKVNRGRGSQAGQVGSDSKTPNQLEHYSQPLVQSATVRTTPHTKESYPSTWPANKQRHCTGKKGSHWWDSGCHRHRVHSTQPTLGGSTPSSFDSLGRVDHPPGKPHTQDFWSLRKTGDPFTHKSAISTSKRLHGELHTTVCHSTPWHSSVLD